VPQSPRSSIGCPLKSRPTTTSCPCTAACRSRQKTSFQFPPMAWGMDAIRPAGVPTYVVNEGRGSAPGPPAKLSGKVLTRTPFGRSVTSRHGQRRLGQICSWQTALAGPTRPRSRACGIWIFIASVYLSMSMHRRSRCVKGIDSTVRDDSNSPSRCPAACSHRSL
jgi:hypothetical protein